MTKDEIFYIHFQIGVAFTVIFASLLYYRRKLKKTEAEIAAQEVFEKQIDQEKNESSPKKYRTLSEHSGKGYKILNEFLFLIFFSGKKNKILINKNFNLKPQLVDEHVHISAPVAKPEPEISPEKPEPPEPVSQNLDKWENVKESNISEILANQEELRKDEKKDSAFETSESEAENLERRQYQPGLSLSEVTFDQNKNTDSESFRLRPQETTNLKVYILFLNSIASQ